MNIYSQLFAVTFPTLNAQEVLLAFNAVANLRQYTKDQKSMFAANVLESQEHEQLKERDALSKWMKGV